MVINWRNNIYQLENIIKKSLNSDSSALAQEHLQSLIDCIMDIAEKRYSLVQKFEAYTIRAHALQWKHNNDDTKFQKELKNLNKGAYEENREIVAKLKDEVIKMKKEIEINTQQYNDIQKENEVLAPQAEQAKRCWSITCGMMNDTLNMRGQMRLRINKFKVKSVEMRERAEDLSDEVEKINLETKQYWNYYRTEVERLKKEVEEVAEKIKEQDQKTSVIKEEVTRHEDEIRAYQSQLLKVSEDLEEEESKLDRKIEQTLILHRKSDQKKRAKIQMQTEIRMLEEVIERRKAEHKKTVQNYSRKIRSAMEDIEANCKHKNELALMADVTRKRVMRKKSYALNIKDEKAMEKLSAQESQKKVNAVMFELGKSLSKKMKQMADLGDVKEIREQIEKKYSANLDKLNKAHQRENELREIIKRETSETVDILDKWKKELSEKYDAALETVQENRRRKVACEGVVEVLQNEVVRLDTVSEALTVNIEEKITAAKELEETLSNVIISLKQKNQEKRVSVSEAIELKNELQPIYEEIVQVHEEAQNEYEVVTEDLIALRRKYSIQSNANEYLKAQREDSKDTTANLKKELAQARKAALGQIRRHKAQLNKSGVELYVVIAQSENLEKSNNLFRENCNDLISKLLEIREYIDSTTNTAPQSELQLAFAKQAMQNLWNDEMRTRCVEAAIGANSIEEYKKIKKSSEKQVKLLGSVIDNICELADVFVTTTAVEKRIEKSARKTSN